MSKLKAFLLTIVLVTIPFLSCTNPVLNESISNNSNGSSVEEVIKPEEPKPDPIKPKPEENHKPENIIPQEPSIDEGLPLKVYYNFNNEDHFSPFDIGNGLTIYVSLPYPETINSLEYISKSDIKDSVDITLNKGSFGSYSVRITPKENFTEDVQLQFYDNRGFNKYVISEVITLKPGKESNEKPGPIIKPNPDQGPVIIPHDYKHEKVYWLGGIDKPDEELFMDYKAEGLEIPELDEHGKVIPGSYVKADQNVPRYYIKDSSVMNEDGSTSTPEFGKATWYHVIKAMDNRDDALCWAMSTSSALHWWFDYLGTDLTHKLFEIRRLRTDIPNDAKTLLDGFHGADLHYTPGIDNGIDSRSGIGRYAKSAFDDVGGIPSNLYRLYFLGEDDINGRFNNYKGPKSLGLLEGMGYTWPGGDTGDWLFEDVSLDNRSKNELVNLFKDAINNKCAVVLQQANMENGGMKAAHAIILWGVIFDETEENIVGIYVGDNNLRDGNLTRVDLVYKPNKGRYYYASPFISQDNVGNYIKQTSLYQMTKLYPPSNKVVTWIENKAKELGIE